MGTFTLLLAALGTAQAAGPEQATAFGCQTEFMTNTIVEGKFSACVPHQEMQIRRWVKGFRNAAMVIA
jgi:hypothetical protein